MNFDNLLSLAENNKVNVNQLPKFGTELPAPKKEKKDKPKSEVVRKLVEEKEKERRHKEEHERRKQKEKEKKRLEEEKKKRFVIPKRVSDNSNNASPVSVYSNPENLPTSSGDNSDDYTALKDIGEKSHHKNQYAHSHKSDSSRADKKHTSSSATKTDRETSLSSHKDSRDYKSSSTSNQHRSVHSGEKSYRKEHHSSSDKLSATSSKSSHSSERHIKHSSSGDSASHKREKLNDHSASSSKHSSEKSSDSTSKHKQSSSNFSSSKSSHSSHSSNKLPDKSSKVSKVSAKDLSLEELRAQVKQMKQELEPVEKEKETKENTVANSTTANMFQQYKNRQGVELSEAEKRKAQILSKTQLILQRTKEKLAQEKDAKQSKKRLGKSTSVSSRKEKDSSGQIKSKSVCRDISDSDEEEGPVNLSFNNNFNEEYLTQEPGSILKTIKNKIDEKLSSYNFPDKPPKEKTERQKKEKTVKEKHIKEKTVKEKILKEKIKRYKHKDNRELYEDSKTDSFKIGDDQRQSKMTKHKIVKRYQAQPPPMNFQDLLKLAEKKAKEKVIEPDPVFLPPKKEERPMTQEERERMERQKESRRRVREEEMEFRKRKLNGEDKKSGHPPVSKTENVDKVNAWLSESKKSSQTLPEKGGSKLKAALTGNHREPVLEKFAKPGMISSKPAAFSKQNHSQNKAKSAKYDSENESILACGPSASTKTTLKPVNPYKEESVNPWDRIYGQMQKKKPRPEKRRHEVIESSEEEDEYDEDDDFIDDDDAGDDYSSHIRQIFGYDKRKYKDEDDDIDNMEANFSSIMKEEARSARIGLQEDLEDMRKEEEELRQKKLAKMKKMKYR